MPRQSYAMAQFIKELEAVRPSAKYEYADTDGYGTHRTLVVDDKTAAWLVPVIRSVQDKRIRQRGNRILFSAHPVDGEKADSFSLKSVVDILYPVKKSRKKS